MVSTSGKTRDSVRIHRSKRYESLANYALVIVVLFTIFILGGGVYDIIESPSSVVQTSTGLSSIHPYLGEQTINESIVSMFLFGCGFLGIFLVYRSTKILYDKQKANLQIMIGIGFAIIGVAGAYVLLSLKG